MSAVRAQCPLDHGSNLIVVDRSRSVGASRSLQIGKTLLGIDAVVDGKVVGTDLAERQILDLLDRYPDRKLVLSPIGAQGFLLGRGN
jgi:predicted polyphosphate/ATP-dependent NAD kinase